MKQFFFDNFIISESKYFNKFDKSNLKLITIKNTKTLVFFGFLLRIIFKNKNKKYNIINLMLHVQIVAISKTRKINTAGYIRVFGSRKI